MKILLVNEASGIHNLLKQGLNELGHDVTHVMSTGSAYQGRTVDFYLGYTENDLFAKIKRNLLPFWKIQKIKNVDIVSFILGISAFSGKYAKYKDLSIFKGSNAKLSYIGTGCDECALLRVRPDAKDLPCQTCMIEDQLGKECERQILALRTRAARYAKMVNFSITPVAEYDHCHGFFPHAVHKRIPLPINAKAIEFVPANSGKKKPLVVHSPTRRGFKGTNVVIEALKIVQAQYREVDFELIEGLNYKDYLERMKRCDIYIDQVFSYSAGMAALENLAMGKIVLSGNSSIAKRYFPFSKESPIFDAPADPTKLAETLLSLLANKDRFEHLACQGKHFIEKYHDHVDIARQYLNLWTKGV